MEFLKIPSDEYGKMNMEGGLAGWMGRNLDAAKVKQNEAYKKKYDENIKKGYSPKKASLLADPIIEQFEPDGMVGIGGKIIEKYGIEEVLRKLSPKQRMNQEQLAKFLKNNGVSPKQIEMADIPGLNDKSITQTAEEWLSNMKAERGYGLNSKEVEDGFSDILLQGSDLGSYGTSVSLFNKPKRIPGGKNAGRPRNHFGEEDYAVHTRATDEYLDGSPIRMIQETQNDYAQAERQGKGMFESTLKKDLTKPIQKAAEKYHDYKKVVNRKYLDNRTASRDNKKLKKLEKDLDQAIEFKGLQTKILDSQKRKNRLIKEYDYVVKKRDAHEAQMKQKYPKDKDGSNYNEQDSFDSEDFALHMKDIQAQLYAIDNNGVLDKLFKDFPIKPEVARRTSIMREMNKAMDDGYAKVGIPIQRHGSKRENPLAGKPEVTQSYMQNVPQDFRDIQRHMAKQGIEVELGLPKGQGGTKPPSRWSGEMNEDKLYEVYGNQMEDVLNAAQYHKDNYNTRLEKQFDEFYDMMENFYQDDPVRRYKEFKQRIQNSGMESREAFQEMFEAIESQAGVGAPNAVYTMEFKKPAGRENDSWKDIDVDWKVW